MDDNIEIPYKLVPLGGVAFGETGTKAIPVSVASPLPVDLPLLDTGPALVTPAPLDSVGAMRTISLPTPPATMGLTPIPAGADRALISCAADAVRYTLDGTTAPTASAGYLLAAGADMTVNGVKLMNKAKFVRTTATGSAALAVTFMALEGVVIPAPAPYPQTLFGPSDEGDFFLADADTIELGVSNAVASWTGRAKGHVLGQSIGGRRPAFQSNGTLNWVEFDGMDDVLFYTGVALPHPWTRISAVRLLNIKKGRIFAPGSPTPNNAGYLFFAEQSDTAAMTLNDGEQACQTAIAYADVVITETHDGANSSVRIDVAAPVTGDPGSLTKNGLAIGGNANGDENQAMRVYAVLEIGRALTDSERAQTITYMATRQGRML